ncbi:MAG TPA: hypothetical protein VLK23_11960 [Thermodesulfobacteriota bacterium]|nr:hypothetical protein [Thermodesulfobacteriota bacterium]
MKKVNPLLSVVFALGAVVVFVSSMHADPKYLKKEEVTKTMMEWNKALGVKCEFCHTSNRSQTYKDLAGKAASAEDLSALVHQRIARAMQGYMLDINHKEQKNYTCNTCHQGKADVKVRDSIK